VYKDSIEFLTYFLKARLLENKEDYKANTHQVG